MLPLSTLVVNGYGADSSSKTKDKDLMLEAQHSDEFLMHQRDLAPKRFLQCAKRIRARPDNPRRASIYHLELTIVSPADHRSYSARENRWLIPDLANAVAGVPEQPAQLLARLALGV